jgi:hypothetical protein
MSTAKITSKTVMGIKTETSQSTPIALSASDFMLASDLTIDPDVSPIERDHYRSTIGSLASIPGETTYKVGFKTELKGSGTPGTEYAPLVAALLACGMESTVHAGVEAIGAAVADPDNKGVSPAPLIAIGTPAYSAKSGIVEITLLSTTLTSPEGAIFQGIFYPGDGSAALEGDATISDTAFSAVAFTAGLTKLTLTVNDPDAGGVGLPVSTWQVGDRWTFVYTSASQVDVVLLPTSEATSSSYYGPGKSATINAFFDGVKHVIAGVMGTAKISLTTSGLAILEFSGMGIYADPTDASFPSQSYNATLPAKLVSSSFSMQSLAATISKLDFDLGVTVAKRVDSKAATGILGFVVTKRAVKGSFDPELESVATHAFFNKLAQGTQGALTVTLGATAGNIVIITAPKAQYSGMKYGDRNGLRILQGEFRLNESSGNDEISIAFT